MLLEVRKETGALDECGSNSREEELNNGDDCGVVLSDTELTWEREHAGIERGKVTAEVKR